MRKTTLHSNVSINSLKFYKFYKYFYIQPQAHTAKPGMHHLFYITTEADSHPL